MSSRLVPSETFYDRYRRAYFTTWDIDIIGRKETLQAGDFLEIRTPESDESLVLAGLISQFQRKFPESYIFVISSGNCYFPHYVDSTRVHVLVASSLGQMMQALRAVAALAGGDAVTNGTPLPTPLPRPTSSGCEGRPRLLILFHRLSCVLGVHKGSKLLQEMIPSFRAAATPNSRSSGVVPSDNHQHQHHQQHYHCQSPSTAPQAAAAARRQRAAFSAEEVLAEARDVVRRSMAYSAWISVGAFLRGSESVCGALGKAQSLVDRTVQL